MDADRLLHHGDSALAACAEVLRGLGPDDLARPTPCAEYTVADLGDHLVRSMALLAGSAGGTVPPAISDGRLDGRVVAVAAAALAAWRTRGFAGDVPVGSRRYPAPLGYAIVVLELVVHGWDLARAARRPFDVEAGVLDYLLDQAPLLITADRRGRGFAAAVPVADSARPLARLVAFTGRRL